MSPFFLITFFFNYLFQYSSRNKNNDVAETDDDEGDLIEGSGEFLFGDEDEYEDEEEDIKEVKERYVTQNKTK